MTREENTIPASGSPGSRFGVDGGVLCRGVLAALVLLLSPIAVCGSALAASPTFLKQERDWGVYEASVKGAKTCYALGRPKDQHPKNVRRGPVYFFVTVRPQGGIRNQVNVAIGYPFASKAKASVEVEGKRFALFTRGERAWIADGSRQDELVNAMKRGKEMVVRGLSKRGTHTKDVYSLFGVSAAIKRAREACR